MFTILLFINNELCTSLNQLRGYFEDSPSYGCLVFYDILDYARSGDISSWLREMGESNLADKVDCIDDKLGDSEYFSRLSALMTGKETGPDTFGKPDFSTCFKVEDVSQEETSVGMAVHIQLRILSSVNETYRFGVRTSWGIKGVEVNPFYEKKGGILTKSFTFRKRPNQDFKVVEWLTDVPCASLSGEVLEFVVGSCCFNMIRVEHGLFNMGATEEMGIPCDDERPVHKVTLTNDYYIGETPVTQALWKAVMVYNPSWFMGDSLPVEHVSWDDCQDFIQKLKCITGKSFRLPTEAEWEFAARGGNKSKRTPYSGCDNIDNVAWYDGNSDYGTHPVKTKQANELGIHDMSGNVWEWCQDWYGMYCRHDQICPTGPENGEYCVVRGGSWHNLQEGCMSSTRWRCAPGYRDYNLGLRLVLSE